MAIQLPIGAESNFKGMIDLVRMQAYVYHTDAQGAMYEVEAIPADLADQAKEYREKLIEAAVDMLAAAERPILYTGGGIINSGPIASQLLRELALWS